MGESQSPSFVRVAKHAHIVWPQTSLNVSLWRAYDGGAGWKAIFGDSVGFYDRIKEMIWLKFIDKYSSELIDKSGLCT